MHVRHVLVSLTLAASAAVPPALALAGPQDRDGSVALTPVAAVTGLPGANLGDMSFWGDRMVVGFGNAEPSGGFALIDIADPAAPHVRSTVRCAGSTNDVTLYGDLVLVSVDALEHGGPTRCDSPDPLVRKGGLRVFSVADPARPVEVRDIVTTCHGSHNHVAVPDLDHRAPDGTPDPRLLVSLMNARCGDDLKTGVQNDPVEVVVVPLHRPEQARLLDTSIDLVKDAGGCHDLTVLAPRKLALAACTEAAQLWDVRDPAEPVRLADLDAHTPSGDRPSDLNVNSNHSAAFSLDGDVLVVGEESGGGLVNACNRQQDRRGMLRFYDVRDPSTPRYRSSFKIDELVPGEACTPHLFNVVHTNDGRRLFTVAWMSGGVRVLDATDPARVREVAAHPGGVAYAAYEYRGHVYASYIQPAFVPYAGGAGPSRGLQVLRLEGVQTRRLDALDPQVQQVGGPPPHGRS